MDRKNIKLTLAYDGTQYHGFQRQNNAIGIQDVLEEGLLRLYGYEIKVAGAGRTDAGVHARGQVVHFFADGRIPDDKIPRALNRVLPKDIVAIGAEFADNDFHARYNAKGKIYSYTVVNQKYADPLRRNYAWHIIKPLSLEDMQCALDEVQGTHDFSAFRAVGGANGSPVRTIYKATCERQDGVLQFIFHGNGFLYHMVRNLIGTIVEIGMGKRKPKEMGQLLQHRDRTKAGVTAPPQGLCLEQVFY